MLESTIAATTIMTLAGLLGWASLLVLMAFLFVGSFGVFDLGLGTTAALCLDAGLCLAFFLQHSIMVRKSFRRWQAKAVPAEYGDAIYAIASGFILLAMVVFWQVPDWPVVAVQGAFRVPFWGLFFLSIAGFAWGVRSFKHFDPFGITAIRHRLRGTHPRPQPFVAVGPYRRVRHPLYLFMMLMIWSCPTLTMDRLLFNLLWTAWITLVGTVMEERDLVAEFGDTYREYQRAVPMLIPFPLPRALEAPHSRPDKPDPR